MILAHARTPDSDWLGTREGLKKVNRTTGQTEVIGGLPRGAVVAVAPEAVLVQEPSRLSACLAESGGRWRVVGELPSTPNTIGWGWQPTLARGWVAVSASHVAFVPRQVNRESTPFALLVSRTGKVTSFAWDPALHADHAAVQITAVHLDRDTLWLGTDVGVLTVRPGQPWQRLLPGYAVDAALGQPDGLQLVARSRRPPGSPWGLLQRGVSGTVKPFASRPTRPKAPALWGERPPSALVRASDGALWCTVAGTEGLEQNISKAQMMVSTRFHRWDGTLWQEFGGDTLAKVPDEALFGLVSGPYAAVLKTPHPILLKRFPRWFG